MLPTSISEARINSAVITVRTIFSALVYACGIFQWEYWPLTSVPMYSFYRDPELHHAEHLADEAQAQQCAKEFVASTLPHAIGWSDDWVTIRLTQLPSAPG